MHRSRTRYTIASIPFVYLLCAVLTSCGNATVATHWQMEGGFAYRLAGAGLAARMETRALAGQVIMAGVTGAGQMPDWNERFIRELAPGAVVLFGFNVSEKPWDMVSYLDTVRSACTTVAPFIAIDHEGGPVFRFKAGLTRLPAPRDIGVVGDKAAQTAGYIAGTELRALGISLNLAPVVEASDKRNREFLGPRAWADTYARAGHLASLFLRSCQEAGTAGAIKHFPGNAAVDPHKARAMLDASMEELEEQHLAAFRLALACEPTAVVLSHVWASALDPDNPVTLSAKAIELLKVELGFTGIALTDDILMQGLGGEPMGPANAVAALSAGADMIMMSGGAVMMKARDAILQAVQGGQLSLARLQDAAARVLAQKLRFGLLGQHEQHASFAEFTKLVEENRARLKEVMKP